MNEAVYDFIYIFTGVIDIILSFVLICMFARAILSLFPLAEGNAIEEFLYLFTEPFILPVRAVIEKFDFAKSMPIDFSFTISFILLSIVTDLLSML